MTREREPEAEDADEEAFPAVLDLSALPEGDAPVAAAPPEPPRRRGRREAPESTPATTDRRAEAQDTPAQDDLPMADGPARRRGRRSPAPGPAVPAAPVAEAPVAPGDAPRLVDDVELAIGESTTVATPAPDEAGIDASEGPSDLAMAASAEPGPDIGTHADHAGVTPLDAEVVTADAGCPQADADVLAGADAPVDLREPVMPTDAGHPSAEALVAAPVDRPEASVAPPRLESPLVEELGPIEKPVAGEEAPVPPPPPVDALPPAELRPVVEALLFVSHKPLTVERMCRALPGLESHYAEGFLHGLAARYDAEGRGWALVRESGGWRLLTRAEHHAWVRQLDRRDPPARLTRGAIEVLSVIAYKQPVARGAIEDIRGVQCAHVIQQLLELRLVRVVGRDEGTLGRPWLYGTTDQFLTRFGLGSIDDLPRRHEFGG